MSDKTKEEILQVLAKNARRCEYAAESLKEGEVEEAMRWVTLAFDDLKDLTK